MTIMALLIEFALDVVAVIALIIFVCFFIKITWKSELADDMMDKLKTNYKEYSYQFY